MSNPTQSADSHEQEITPEERCQNLIDSVADMRVRYPAYIARLDEKIVKINIALLKKKFKAHRDVKFPTPKYSNIDIDFNPQDCEKLKTSFKQHRELLKKMENLRKMGNQIKNDRIGRILNEDIDTETLIKRVERKLDDKKDTKCENMM